MSMVAAVGVREPEADGLDDVFECLGERNRRRIVRALGGHALCNCDLMERLAMGQQAITYHVRIMQLRELIECTRIGRSVYIRLTMRGRAALDVLRAFEG